MYGIMDIENVIKELKIKAKNCGDSTRESRARKGAYVDAVIIIEEAMDVGINTMIELNKQL